MHLTDWVKANESLIDRVLEEQMEYAQKITSLVLSIRKKENIKVRQPLQKILIPLVDERMKDEIKHVQGLILSEVNVKELEFTDAIAKSIKPNFKTLGKKVGAKMKEVAAAVSAFGQEQIAEIEQKSSISIDIQGETILIEREDVEILSKEITGYKVANEGKITVALDIEIDEKLRTEGVAREIISRLQNLRKESNFEVMDKINVIIQKHPYLSGAINDYKTYICTEILAASIIEVEQLTDAAEIDIDENKILVQLSKS